MSKNVLKSFSNKCWNCFEVFFRKKNFSQCTLEGRNLEKGQKNGKTFIFLQKAQIHSQKGSKTFWTCFEVVFLVKKLTSAPWTVETWKNSKKNRQNLKFQKCPKTVLKVSKQILNLFWGNFLGKNCPVHPGRSKLGKTSKNWKAFNFQNAQIRSQKCSNLFSTCFEVFFPVKKFAQCTLEGKEIEKFQKMQKNSIFQNPENVSKSVQISSEVNFPELFLTSATWRSKLVEIRKKIEKNWIPKSVQKRS